VSFKAALFYHEDTKITKDTKISWGPQEVFVSFVFFVSS